jgi:hypothetical protein
MSKEVEKLRVPALNPGSMISSYKGMPLEPQVFVCECSGDPQEICTLKNSIDGSQQGYLIVPWMSF